jgi:hypothetical protein
MKLKALAPTQSLYKLKDCRLPTGGVSHDRLASLVTINHCMRNRSAAFSTTWISKLAKCIIIFVQFGQKYPSAANIL